MHGAAARRLYKFSRRRRRRAGRGWMDAVVLIAHQVTTLSSEDGMASRHQPRDAQRDDITGSRNNLDEKIENTES